MLYTIACKDGQKHLEHRLSCHVPIGSSYASAAGLMCNQMPETAINNYAPSNGDNLSQNCETNYLKVSFLSLQSPNPVQVTMSTRFGSSPITRTLLKALPALSSQCGRAVLGCCLPVAFDFIVSARGLPPGFCTEESKLSSTNTCQLLCYLSESIALHVTEAQICARSRAGLVSSIGFSISFFTRKSEVDA